MSQYKKIICGKLYNGIDPDFHEKMEILVDGKTISAVGKNLSCPADTEVIDLAHLTVTPGMIDAHVHPSFFDWRTAYQDTFENSDGWRCLAIARNVAKTLETGFTTIRTLGWFREDYIMDVKRAVNEGYIDGSRMVVAAHMLRTPGSHGDMTKLLRNDPQHMLLLSNLLPANGSGADYFVRATRHEITLGSDLIKILAGGGFFAPNDDPEHTHMTDDELRAIIDTARMHHVPVTIHAYGPELIQKAVRFGVTGVEHGSLMDEETARMMEESSTYLVPTFCPYEDAVNPDEASLSQKSATFRAKLEKFQKRLQEGRRVILDSKIKLGYGTDLVAVHDSFECGWEYHFWMKNGIDPFFIMQAATKNNAEILEIGHLVGTIEPGKLADISGWGRDLLTDPDSLRDCAFVMKEGKQYQARSHMNL